MSKREKLPHQSIKRPKVGPSEGAGAGVPPPPPPLKGESRPGGEIPTSDGQNPSPASTPTDSGNDEK